MSAHHDDACDRRAARAAADCAVRPADAARVVGLAVGAAGAARLAEAGVAAASRAFLQVARRLQRRHRAARAARTARRPPARHRVGRQSRPRARARGEDVRPAARRLHAGRRAAGPSSTRSARHGADLRADGRDYDEAERMAKAFADDDRRRVHLAVQRSPTSSPAPATDRARDVRGRAGHRHARRADRRRRPDQRRRGRREGDPAALPRRSASKWRRRAPFRQACAPDGSSRSFPARRSPTASAAIRIRTPSPSDLIQRFVDDIVTVSEDDLARAIVGLAEAEHLSPKAPARSASRRCWQGASSLAGRRHVGVLVTGGNIDLAKLRTLLTESNA